MPAKDAAWVVVGRVDRIDERRPAASAVHGRRRPSWLTVAIVGAVCSAVVGPILTIIAKGILAAHL